MEDNSWLSVIVVVSEEYTTMACKRLIITREHRTGLRVIFTRRQTKGKWWRMEKYIQVGIVGVGVVDWTKWNGVVDKKPLNKRPKKVFVVGQKDTTTANAGKLHSQNTCTGSAVVASLIS